jgi:type I restriction enzyme S subunit
MLIRRGSRNLTEQGLRSSSAVLLPAGTVLFSSRAPIGRVAIAANELSTNQGFKNLTPYPGILSTYVFYYLKASKALAQSRASGTTFLELSAAKFARIPIPVPPTAEQQRIVARLDELFTRLDAAVEALQRVKAQLARYRQAVLKAAFEGKLTERWRSRSNSAAGTPSEHTGPQTPTESPASARAHTRAANEPAVLPASWRWKTVGQIATSIQYGYTARARREPVGPRFLRITDIQDGRVNWARVPFCQIDEKETLTFQLTAGDIVFARSGATVGKTYLVRPGDPPAVFASYLVRLKMGETCTPEYLYRFFQSPLYWAQIARSKVGIGQANVSGRALSQILVPVPPLAEQCAIIEAIDASLSLAERAEEAIQGALYRAERLRQAILKRAFEGRLVPQDPNDEPAEVLLERIRAQKVQRAAGGKRGRGGRDPSPGPSPALGTWSDRPARGRGSAPP